MLILITVHCIQITKSDIIHFFLIIAWQLCCHYMLNSIQLENYKVISWPLFALYDMAKFFQADHVGVYCNYSVCGDEAWISIQYQ